MGNRCFRRARPKSDVTSTASSTAPPHLAGCNVAFTPSEKRIIGSSGTPSLLLIPSSSARGSNSASMRKVTSNSLSRESKQDSSHTKPALSFKTSNLNDNMFLSRFDGRVNFDFGIPETNLIDASLKNDVDLFSHWWKQFVSLLDKDKTDMLSQEIRANITNFILFAMAEDSVQVEQLVVPANANDGESGNEADVEAETEEKQLTPRNRSSTKGGSNTGSDSEDHDGFVYMGDIASTTTSPVAVAATGDVQLSTISLKNLSVVDLINDMLAMVIGDLTVDGGFVEEDEFNPESTPSETNQVETVLWRKQFLHLFGTSFQFDAEHAYFFAKGLELAVDQSLKYLTNPTGDIRIPLSPQTESSTVEHQDEDVKECASALTLHVRRGIRVACKMMLEYRLGEMSADQMFGSGFECVDHLDVLVDHVDDVDRAVGFWKAFITPLPEEKHHQLSLRLYTILLTRLDGNIAEELDESLERISFEMVSHLDVFFVKLGEHKHTECIRKLQKVGTTHMTTLGISPELFGIITDVVESGFSSFFAKDFDLGMSISVTFVVEWFADVMRQGATMEGADFSELLSRRSASGFGLSSFFSSSPSVSKSGSISINTNNMMRDVFSGKHVSFGMVQYDVHPLRVAKIASKHTTNLSVDGSVDSFGRSDFGTAVAVTPPPDSEIRTLDELPANGRPMSTRGRARAPSKQAQHTAKILAHMRAKSVGNLRVASLHGKSMSTRLKREALDEEKFSKLLHFRRHFLIAAHFWQTHVTRGSKRFREKISDKTFQFIAEHFDMTDRGLVHSIMDKYSTQYNIVTLIDNFFDLIDRSVLYSRQPQVRADALLVGAKLNLQAQSKSTGSVHRHNNSTTLVASRGKTVETRVRASTRTSHLESKKSKRTNLMDVPRATIPITISVPIDSSFDENKDSDAMGETPSPSASPTSEFSISFAEDTVVQREPPSLLARPSMTMHFALAEEHISPRTGAHSLSINSVSGRMQWVSLSQNNVMPRQDEQVNLITELRRIGRRYNVDGVDEDFLRKMIHALLEVCENVFDKETVFDSRVKNSVHVVLRIGSKLVVA